MKLGLIRADDPVLETYHKYPLSRLSVAHWLLLAWKGKIEVFRENGVEVTLYRWRDKIYVAKLNDTG